MQINRLIGLISLFFSLFVLSGCVFTNSFIVFDNGRLSNQELNQLVGVYSKGNTKISVERASNQTDLLAFNYGEQGQSDKQTSGRAIISRLPDTDVYLASLDFSVFRGDRIEDWGSVTAIALYKRLDSNSFEWFPIPFDSEFAKTVEIIKNPEDEAAYIKQYLSRNHSEFAKQTGQIFVRKQAPAGQPDISSSETNPQRLASADGLYMINDFGIFQHRYTGELTRGGAPIYDVVVIQLPGPGHFAYGRRLKGISVGDVSARGAYFPDTQQFYEQQRAVSSGTRCVFFNELDWTPILEQTNIAMPWDPPFMAFKGTKKYAEGRRASKRKCVKPRVSERTCEMVGCRLWEDQDTSRDLEATYVPSFEDAVRLFNDPIR